jgi:hypothetical protein
MIACIFKTNLKLQCENVTYPHGGGEGERALHTARTVIECECLSHFFLSSFGDHIIIAKKRKREQTMLRCKPKLGVSS